MAAHSPAGMHLHHGPPNGPPLPPGIPQQQWPPAQQMAAVNEQVWLSVGSLSELLGNLDEAVVAYEHAIRHNPRSIPAMNAISSILRTQEQFAKAVEYLQNILKLDTNNGDVWGSLGHCYLMMDDLQQAYSAYQQALYHLRDPKEPKLWYGIGILYDRYGSLEHAEEAFSQVMRMQPDFEKANEIYFRLGIIYKQQQKYSQSLECFRYIVEVPPTPLTQEDIWFQIGHVHEQQKDYDNAKSAYRRVLDRDPNHAKVLQQLGWLFHQQSNSFSSQETAIDYLEKSVNSDQTDAQSWYLLGRCYMSQQKYPKAYEAYQQAVYRDGRNPTFWCSIGVLYYQINQYRDALDAYSRAIRLNPYISEVWYDLGTLYESCNNQVGDALDAYQRAAELDPTNVHIKARLQLLRSGQTNGLPIQTSAPLPQDVHPQAYQANGAVGPPTQWGGSAPQAPAPGPPPPGPNANGWGSSRLAEINPPPQPPNPYDQRESRGPPGQGPIPPAQRGPSPRQEQMRPYQGPGSDRGPPPALRRSPPREHHPMAPYQQQGPPPPQQTQQAPPPPPSQGQGPPARVPNPNYVPPSAGLPSAPRDINGGGAGPSPLTPFGRNSPRPEIRPIVDNTSPKSNYPHQMQFTHHPNHSNPGGIEGGAPAPVAALVAAEAAAAERTGDRPGSVENKRRREWEEEPSIKKPASDEARARLDDMHHRRPSTPPRQEFRRSSSEVRRVEDQRRLDETRRHEDQRRREEQLRAEEQQRAEQQRQSEAPHPQHYLPSEAAHHPTTHALPPPPPPAVQKAPGPVRTPVNERPPPPTPQSATKEFPKDDRPRSRERVEHLPPPPPPPAAPAGEPERAIRKVDVDEDYDDSGEEDKKGGILPASANANTGNTVEVKVASPNGVNGHVNGQTKVESS